MIRAADNARGMVVIEKGRAGARPFGFQRGVKPGCGLASALRIFCRLRCALRSSLEPSARCGSSAAIWRSSVFSSPLVHRASSVCDITLISSSIGSGCGHRGLMRTAGALRRAVHPAGPKRREGVPLAALAPAQSRSSYHFKYGERTRASRRAGGSGVSRTELKGCRWRRTRSAAASASGRARQSGGKEDVPEVRIAAKTLR
jgi:hypothetical protein